MKKLQMLLLALFLGTQFMPAFGQMTMLSDDEKADIIYMLEEEKMARDVYVTLGEKWDDKVFQNISASEERHYSMMKQMALKNDLELPKTVVKDKMGKFENRDIQSLYDELVTAGNLSLVEALKVGAKIEEVDIKDLDAALANTENSELIALYTPLRQGSENHLRAFSKNLEKQGIDYKPIILSKKQYKAILGASASEKNCCSGNEGKACCSGDKKGKGKGEGNGKAMNKGNKKGKGKSCCSSSS